MLAQNGFADVPAPAKSYAQTYPDLDAQLQVLRRTAPTSAEVSIVEGNLDRALQAKYAGNGAAERAELQQARDRLTAAFQGRTSSDRWPMLGWLLAAVSLLGIAWWWARQRKRNRKLALPQDMDDEEAQGDDDTDWVDADDPDADDEDDEG